jgi:hypothetical protein
MAYRILHVFGAIPPRMEAELQAFRRAVSRFNKSEAMPRGILYRDRRQHSPVHLLHLDSRRGRIVDIAIAALYRGKGMSSARIRQLMEAHTSGLPLRLSVTGGNRAAGLYRCLGFVPAGGDKLAADQRVVLLASHFSNLSIGSFVRTRIRYKQIATLSHLEVLGHVSASSLLVCARSSAARFSAI